MARLSSWLSTDVMHALGWALIHSLWQCVGLAALAAILMAFSRRPSVRYLVAATTLIAMLAAPVATFLILMKPAAPVHAVAPANPSRPLLAVLAVVKPQTAASITQATAPTLMRKSVAIALADTGEEVLPRNFLAADFLPPNILSWLVGAWLSGVVLFCLRFAGGFLLLERKRHAQSNPPRSHILALCRELERQLGLTRAIRYLECNWLQAPGVIGWLRPVILLPVSALTGLSEAQLRAVIAHELAHIRRHDFFVNLLQILAETLLFYHPAIWWLNARLRAERELCCDEIAVSLTGDRLEYAKVLTLMAAWEKAPELAMAANRGPLSERIFHILGKKPLGAGRRMLGVTGSVLFLAVALGAANALLGIAYPIPAAHAVPKMIPAASQVAIAPAALLAPQAAAPVAKDSAPDQSGGDALTRQNTVLAEKPLAPLPDLSRLLPVENLPASRLIAANDPAPIPPASNSPAATQVALNDQAGMPNPAEPVTAENCAPPQLLNSLPMEPVPGSDLMTVAASIDGRPHKLLVAVGDLSTQLWDTPATKLDLAVLNRGRFMDAGGRFSEGVARVEHFSLGSMETGNFEIAVRPDPDFPNADFDGVLGTNMMQRYDIDLDFAHRRLNYFTPEACKGGGIYWAPSTISSVQLVTYSGVVYVPVTLDGHTIVALLDTSANRTFLNPQLAERMFGLKPEALEAGTVTDGGALIKAGLHRFSRLTFGGLTIDNPEIAVPFNIMTQDTGEFHASRVLMNRYPLSELLPPMIIGMDVLKQSHLYISFRNQRVYISPAGDGRTLQQQAPTTTSWFNVWTRGYDDYLPYLHRFFAL